MTMLFELPAEDLRRMPTEPIVRTADIDGSYRWLLERAWGPGPCVLWCGLNPSTADGTRDDPTMLREIGFSYRLGFGSLIKVNIYPFIASTQSDLRRWLRDLRAENKEAEAAWHSNMQRVHEQVAKTEMHIAAWGNGADPQHLKEFLEGIEWDVDEHMQVREVRVAWHCLGTNIDGGAKHSLARGVHRIPDDARPTPWSRPA